MEQDAIKTRAELIAIEYMLANIYASMFGERFREKALPAYQDFAAKMREHIATWTVPGLDAALSDHLTAEIQECIEFQLSLIDDLLQQKIAVYREQAAGKS